MHISRITKTPRGIELYWSSGGVVWKLVCCGCIVWWVSFSHVTERDFATRQYNLFILGGAFIALLATVKVAESVLGCRPANDKTYFQFPTTKGSYLYQGGAMYVRGRDVIRGKGFRMSLFFSNTDTDTRRILAPMCGYSYSINQSLNHHTPTVCQHASTPHAMSIN